MTTPALTQVDRSAGVWLRALAPLFFATTIVGLVGAFTNPLMALFLTDTVKAGPAFTSLFLFLTSLAGVAVAGVAGHVSDRPGTRRAVLTTAAISGAAGFAVFAAVQDYWALLATSLSLVALSGSLLPQIFALGREILDRANPDRATMGMNALRMALSLSWAAGAPLGTAVVGIIGFGGLFLATAVAHVAVLAVVWSLKSTRPAAEAPAEAPAAPSAAAPSVSAPSAAAGSASAGSASAGSASAEAPAMGTAAPAPAVPGTGRADRGASGLRLLSINAAFVVLQMSPSLTVMTMSLFVSKDLHGSLTSAGVVLGVCATIEVPLMLVFGALAGRFPLRPLLLAGGVFGSAYCLVASLADRVWEMAAAQLLQACFICAIGGLGISYFQQLMPSALGRATTMFTNSSRIAGMLAGLFFGIVEVHGYRLAFVASLGFCVVGTAILASAERVRHAPPSRPGERPDVPRGPRRTGSRRPVRVATRPRRGPQIVGPRRGPQAKARPPASEVAS